MCTLDLVDPYIAARLARAMNLNYEEELRARSAFIMMSSVIELNAALMTYHQTISVIEREPTNGESMMKPVLKGLREVLDIWDDYKSSSRQDHSRILM